LELAPIALGLVLAVSFGTSDYLSKGVTSQIGPYRTTVYILALSGVGMLIPGLFLSSSLVVTPLLALILLTVAVTTLAGFAFMYRAYSRGALSLTAPIVNSYPAFSIIISILFLGATLSAEAVFALVGVIAGIVLVSTSFSDLRRRVSSVGALLSPGVGSALIASALYAVSWTAFGSATESLGYILPVLFVRCVPALIGLAVAPALHQDVRIPAPRHTGEGRWLPRLLLMGLLEAVGVTLFSLGVKIAPTPDTIPILATFAGMAGAVTVTYAIILLRERLELNHVIGVFLLIAGVAALLFLTS
jgi:drug/metabolite transporter (DMT)-like permease